MGGVAIPPPANMYNDEYGGSESGGGEEAGDEYGGGGEYGSGTTTEPEFKAPPPPPPVGGEMGPPPPKPSITELIRNPSKVVLCKVPVPQTSHKIDCVFGFSLLYTDPVPFELLDSAALLWRSAAVEGAKWYFLI
jgi:hypothetical protein